MSQLTISVWLLVLTAVAAEVTPSHDTGPHNEVVIEGTTVTLHCNATGNPAPNITWTRDRREVGKGEKLSFEAYRNHSGVYWCSTDNGLNRTFNASYNLDVYYPPSLHTRPSKQTVLEDTNVTMRCSATGHPVPTITWYKEGKAIASGETLSLNGHRNVAGKYWCSADNGVGEGVNASVDIDVQFPAAIATKPENKTVVESEVATFHCTATGYPAPTIRWTNNGELLEEGDTLSFPTNRNQSGLYLCTADNGLSEAVVASAYLDVLYAPRIMTRPSDKTVIETAMVVFFCNATGNPRPLIRWTRNGTAVANGTTLSFVAKRNDTGVYQCSADNGLETSASSSATLQVQYPPSLHTRPSKQTVLEDTNVTMRCSATGHPVPTITWYKEGKAIASGETLSLNGHRNVAGKYWCSADNGVGEAVNASVDIDVQFPAAIATKPENKTVVESEVATFHCTATGYPAPTIRWTNNGELLEEGDTLSFPTNRNQSGLYLCTADNGLSEAVVASAYLDVLYAPRIVTRPSDKTVIETAMVVFFCNATGNPRPLIRWTRNGTAVANGTTLSFVAKRNDTGVYQCSADNGLETSASSSATLQVQYPPSLHTRPSKQTVLEDTNVTMRCSATGHPVPTITWYKEGKAIASGETLSLNGHRNVAGKYWCSADNGVGEAVNASADIDVQFPAAIATKPENKTVVESEVATFHCTATGYPAPTIRWTNNGELLEEGDTLSFPTNRNQSGLYLCTADNGLSEAVVASAYLDVLYAPRIVTRPSDKTVIETAMVVFFCNATGNPRPLIRWTRNGTAVADGTTLSFVAKRNDTGVYQCSADNGLETSASSSATLQVQYPPSLHTRPSKQTVLEDTNVTMRCSATGHPVPTITWYKEGKAIASGETLSLNGHRNVAGKYWCSADNGVGEAVNASADIDVQFPAAIATKPENKTVVESEVATFHCTATGYPAPTIRWTNNGELLEEGDTLSFPTNRNQSGLYLCTADNGLSEAVVASAYLDVLYAPRIMTRPSDKTVIETAMVVFFCNATGKPRPLIRWTRNGTAVANGTTLSFVAKRNDTGVYQCSADNGLETSASSSATLQVQYPPSLHTRPSKQTVLEDTNVTMRCSATGHPVPTITWYKEGKAIASGETLSLNGHRNVAGKYWCSADNGVGEAVNASADIDVQFPAAIATKPENKTVVESEVATFHCTATGYPAPTIRWTNNGELLEEGDTLSFPANRNQSGLYLCTADNGLSEAVVASAYLDVLYAPRIVTRPSDKTVIETAMVVFFCNATGNPRPLIRWTRNGTAVADGTTLSFVAKRNDTGVYQCSADNGLETSASSSATLQVQYPPSLHTRPSKQTVLEDTNVTMRCSATGHPVPTITWYKEGKAIASGETLSLNGHRNVAGKYWCSADNGVGEAVNASADIDVQFPAAIATKPENKTVVESEVATFHCTATGYPAPTIRWTNNGELLEEGDTLSFPANRNQSGLYLCTADNGLSEAVVASAYLDVLYAPRIMTRPSDKTVIETAMVVFFCNATGKPRPLIRWTRNGTAVANGTTLSFVAKRNDTGVYQCSADNGLETSASSSATLQVQYPPSLHTRPSKQTVLEDTNVTMRCSATGHPVPTITWYKEGKAIASGETLSLNGHRNVAGKYWCSADNGVGEAVNASADIDVQFPAAIATKPENKTVVESEVATFHCTATGYPAPTIRWTNNGELLEEGDTLSFPTNRNQSGLYLCTADNGLSEAVVASAYLDVLYAPRIMTRPSDKTVIETAMVVFFCNATGNPRPLIRWTRNGTAVANGTTLSFVAKRNDTGVYQCSADNGLETSASSSATLQVQYPPSLHTRPSKQTVLEDTNVTMRCSATGHPVPTITWYKEGKAIASGETLSLNGHRNVAGKYWCSADNGVGEAVNASADIDVQFPAAIATKPENKTVVESEVATFHCTATGYPAPTIRWTNNGELLEEGDTLSFPANRNQSGLYLCTADNGLSEAVVASAYLDVLYAPRIVTRPSDKTVIETAMVVFFCNATGNPRPLIRWTRNGTAVADGTTLSFVAKRNDTGVYQCSADNGLETSASSSATLQVQYPPSLHTRPSKQTVLEDTNVTMRCSATGHPVPTITWYKEGKAIASGETLSLNGHRNVAGKYWCSADNGVGEAVNASADIDVQSKPEHTNLSVNVDIAKRVPFGISIELTCTTHAHPGADGFKFYRDEDLLGSNSTGLYNLKLERSAVYSCVPFNSIGDGERATLQINVMAWKPSFENIFFGPFYLFKGIQARLPCQPPAKPYPTIKWFKDGVALEYENNGSYILDSDGTLVIRKVGDSDAGRYTCTAENYLGEATATADGIILERTKLVLKPQNQTVPEGSSVRLPCKASKDRSLELRYNWKKDGGVIADVSNIQWRETGYMLELSNLSFQDAGVYTCVAYTPEPRSSEDSVAVIVSIEGAPPPPSNLQITDCSHGRTNLSWVPVLSNLTSVTHYLVEQETNHAPTVFDVIFNVTNPNSTSLTLQLPKWSDLRFRVRAVSEVGPSRPSEATAKDGCSTPVGVPEIYPNNLRGIPRKANELSIKWTPLSKTEWNAPGCYYMLKYKKANSPGRWTTEKIGDPHVRVFSIPDPGYNQMWEFKISAGNHEGPGPESPISRSLSGQDAPDVKPEGAKMQAETANTVTLEWKPVTLLRGSVDGYKIYYWVKDRATFSRRRRQAIPMNANVLVVKGGETQQASLTGLKPYTNYHVVVKAFNSGGEGPASTLIAVQTSEGVPSPPSDLKIYAFGEYIFVTWKLPQDPNGIVTSYQVGSQEYSGSVVEKAPVSMETVQPDVFEKLLGKLAFEKSYVVEVRAQTSKGWGESVRKIVTTVKRSAPAKPKAPTVVQSLKDSFTVTYNFEVGGGWTSEFKVLYRKKGGSDQFQETDWVDHFSTKKVEIKNLKPAVYEFKIVGRNAVGKSPDSDIVETRVEGVPVIGRQVKSPAVYRSDWFITLMIISAGTLLLLVIVFVYRRRKRRQRSNFKVSEHEKEPKKEQNELGSISVEIKRREEWKKSLEDRLDVESQDSLDEYGGNTPYFTEDGSFIGDLHQGRNRTSVYDTINSPVA